MSNYTPTENQLGIQGIAVSSTTQNHDLGKIIRARDSTLGEAEFIYLLGVANTVIGLLVTWNATTFQTALVAASAKNQDNPVGVAMSANVASQYGWYQIGGLASVLKTAVTVNPQVSLFTSATSGRVKVLASAGQQVLGCRSANLATVTSTTSTITALINRPFLQGQIT